MLTSKQLSKELTRLFYIHRELPLAVGMLVSACIELACALVVEQPWQTLAYVFAAALALIAGVLIANVIRFEKKWGAK